VDNVSVFTCGPPKDHECNSDGKFLYGLSNGTTTYDLAVAKQFGYTWGSVTCSVCGMSSMEKSMWQDG